MRVRSSVSCGIAATGPLAANKPSCTLDTVPAFRQCSAHIGSPFPWAPPRPTQHSHLIARTMEGRGVRIERIADRKLREAVFRRRKNGLLRRAMELSVMADCEVAVLVFHGSGQLTQYSSSPIGGLLQKFARACCKPHETYNNEDLYTHHVLAQLAGDVEEAAGQAAKRARTLPSFWAAKAALERQQRMQAGRRLEAARMRQPVGGEDERMGEGGPQGGPEEEGEAREEEEEGEGQARAGKRRRTASAAAKQQQQQQQHGGHQEEEDESLSDFKDLDRHAAALAELAGDVSGRFSPRSRHAYQRIHREFDRLVARAREEIEVAEAMAAVGSEDPPAQGEGDTSGEEQAAIDERSPATSTGQRAVPAPSLIPAPVQQQAQQEAEKTPELAAEVAAGKAYVPAWVLAAGIPPASTAAAGIPDTATAAVAEDGSSPASAVVSPRSQEGPPSPSSLTHLPHQLPTQPGQQPTPSTPTPLTVPATATAAATQPLGGASAPAAAAVLPAGLPAAAAAAPSQALQHTPGPTPGMPLAAGSAAMLPPAPQQVQVQAAAGGPEAQPAVPRKSARGAAKQQQQQQKQQQQQQHKPSPQQHLSKQQQAQQQQAGRLSAQPVPLGGGGGGGILQRPRAVPVPGAGAAVGGVTTLPGQHPPGPAMMLQLPGMALQSAQLQQYQRLLQQQQFVAMQTAVKAAHMHAAQQQQQMHAQYQQQQQQQQGAAHATAAMPRGMHASQAVAAAPQQQALLAANDVVLPIVSQPQGHAPSLLPEPDHDPVADMLV